MLSYQQPQALPPKRRPSARDARIQQYGLGDQITYENRQRADRDQLKATIDAQHKAAIDAAAKRMQKNKANSTGMNAGTVGGAYLSMFQRR